MNKLSEISNKSKNTAKHDIVDSDPHTYSAMSIIWTNNWFSSEGGKTLRIAKA